MLLDTTLLTSAASSEIHLRSSLQSIHDVIKVTPDSE